MAIGPTQRHFAPFFSPSQISAKTVLWALGTALVMVACIWVVWRAGWSIALTLASLLLAIAIDHAVQWLVNHGWRRSWAIATTMSALVLVLIASAVAFIPSAIHQGEMLVSELPNLVDRLRQSDTYQRLNQRLGLDANLARLTGPAEGTSRLASGIVTALSNALLLVGGGLTIFFLALFMLIFGPPLVQRLLDEVRRSRRAYYERIFKRIYTSLGGYIGGVALISGLMAAFSSIALAVLRVPFFLALGMLAGLLNLIPNIGPVIALVLLAIFTFLADGLWKTVAFVIVVIVYKQLENQLIGPLVFKRTASVNPLIGTVVVLVMTEMAGIAGALLAIPLLSSVQVILSEVLAIRREWLAREAPEDAPVSTFRHHHHQRTHRKR